MAFEFNAGYEAAVEDRHAELPARELEDGTAFAAGYAFGKVGEYTAVHGFQKWKRAKCYW